MSFFHSPRIATNGLVFHVDAANIKSYPGTGNFWYDRSPTGATGSLTNVTSAPAYSSSNKGIFNFSGGGYFDYGQPSLQLSNLNQISVLVFCKINTYNGDDSQKTFGVDPIFNLQPNWRTTDTSSRIEFYLSGAWRSAAASQVLTFNDWNLFAATYDGANIKLYKNGTVIATTAFASGTFSAFGLSNLRIGDMGNQGKYLNGGIGTASIYNRALTQSEITQYYNTFKARYGL